VFDAGTITGAVHLDVAANGSLVYVPRIDANLRLTWVDRNGREEPVPAEARPYRHPKVSPDGTRIAVEVEDPSNTDVWVGEVRSGTFTRLTTSEDVDSDPIWTGDGSRVVFSSVRGASGLFWQGADGGGAAEQLATGTGGVRALGWTRSGALVYEELQGADVRVLPLGGASAPQVIPLFDAPEYFNETLPAVSPDGEWLAYQSTESGDMEVYVRPFPDVAGRRWNVSVGGGFAPLWSHDGRELFYRNNMSLMAVAVDTKPTFSAGTPQILFGLGDFVLAGTRGIRYDVAPDGRFLLLKSDSGASQDRIVVVQHWTDELRQLVPVD
jgi:Tol biopolymer transport system component